MLGRTVEELLHGSPGHAPISNAEYGEWVAFLKWENAYADQQAEKKKGR